MKKHKEAGIIELEVALWIGIILFILSLTLKTQVDFKKSIKAEFINYQQEWNRIENGNF